MWGAIPGIVKYIVEKDDRETKQALLKEQLKQVRAEGDLAEQRRQIFQAGLAQSGMLDAITGKAPVIDQTGHGPSSPVPQGPAGLSDQVAQQRMGVPVAQPGPGVVPQQRFDIPMPKPADFFRNAMDPKNAPLYPKQFFQENGDEFIIRNEYGEITDRIPRKVAPESMDIEQAGGGKRKVFYPKFSPPGGVLGATDSSLGPAGPGRGGYVPSKMGEPIPPDAGVEIAPGGIKPEIAGKMNAAFQGVDRLNEAMQMLFEGGDVNKGKLKNRMLFEANVPGGIGEGGLMVDKMAEAISGVLRPESGALISPQETRDKAKAFISGWRDWATGTEKGDKIVRERMRSFRSYVLGLAAMMDPNEQVRAIRSGGMPSGSNGPAVVEAPPASDLKEGFARPITSPTGEKTYWTLEGGKPRRVK